ncbi:oxygenase MpaB family protein, partial [Saccharomonospora halophila]|uniref:oxygenase MpaB family protein n=1 Tax=Saccharomonospora halophila TaxID=129922 RepID=UPI000373B8C2
MTHRDPTGAESLPGPGSVSWRRFGVAPGVFLAGTGLLLQVAHPVVGAGVRDHSEFRRRPWKRAWDTHLSTLRFLYGMGGGADVEGRRLVDVHRDIKGVDDAGRRYHALNPAAYAWVHLTLARYLADTADTFGPPMDADERETMWAEFRAIGFALGLKSHHMAATWAEAEEVFDRTVRETLEANDSTTDVLRALTHPARPTRMLPEPLWRAAIRPAGRLVRFTTVGALPPVLRQRLGISWTARDERAFRRFARVVGAVHRHLPEPLRYAPLAYGLILRGRARGRTARGGTSHAPDDG